MLTIRLSRVGTTKRPFYRVVVMESSAPRDGRFKELLGHYDPRTDPEVLDVDYDRLSHWTDNGARMSDTVRTLVARHPKPEVAEADETPETAAAPAAEAGDGEDQAQVTT